MNEIHKYDGHMVILNLEALIETAGIAVRAAKEDIQSIVNHTPNVRGTDNDTWGNRSQMVSEARQAEDAAHRYHVAVETYIALLEVRTRGVVRFPDMLDINENIATAFKPELVADSANREAARQLYRLEG